MPFDFEFPWLIVVKLLFAAFLGGIIGVERARAGTAAGLRTNIIIAMSTGLFTILATESFGPKNGDTNTIIGHIVTGVGFLGAGTVMHYGERAHGLTTAASIWLVAGLGITAGAGQYFLGFFAAVIAVVVLHMLEPVSERLETYGMQHRRFATPVAVKKTRKSSKRR